MTEFEILLSENMVALKRYVNFKVSNNHDAEDIIQDVCLSATMKFDTLKNTESFKAWIIGIANHKCNDYYRNKSKNINIPIDSLSETALIVGRCGINEQNTVLETIAALGEKDKEIIDLYFFKDLSQEEISKRLSVPIGTVKSRLYYAKEKFKKHYPHSNERIGETVMKKLPKILPEYTIEKSSLAPFNVKSEELMGFSIIPKLNEKITWASYDIPSRKMNDFNDTKVTCKAEVHGIEGVEIVTTHHDCKTNETRESIFIAQLTDTHCRYLASTFMRNGVRKTVTFLDTEDFMNNFGFGEDNCGYETNITHKGKIERDHNNITVKDEEEVVDIVGRYNVTINGKTYDTICVMDIGHYNNRIAIEQYLDKNGRTILWRRFNRNNWANKRYGGLWTELLPENERLTINGDTYVHWYDCITDYIF